MIKNLLLACLFFSSTFLKAQGIEFFHGTWAEALQEAVKTERPIFVDAYTTWCGPCKAMAKNVFTQEEVGKFFNANFINMKLDMETPEGKSFESKYPVSAYPTLFFIDPKGKVIKKVVGGQKAEGLITHGKEALKGNDNSIDYSKEYDAGKRDYDFMLKYIKSLNNVGKPSLKIANDYLASSPNITEDQKMNFIFESATEADSKLFEFILENKSKMIGLIGEEKFNEKVKSACKATLNKSIEYETPELMTEALDKASKGLTKDGDIFKYTSQMYYYQSFKRKDDYLKAADNLYKKSNKDEKTLRFIAEDICKNYKADEKVVKKAADYASELYKMKNSFDNLAFYCKSLMDAKEFDKAISIAEKAFSSKDLKDENEKKQIESLINMLKTKKA
jgi:thiol-disulfide isomerase/thioredoxin